MRDNEITIRVERVMRHVTWELSGSVLSLSTDDGVELRIELSEDVQKRVSAMPGRIGVDLDLCEDRDFLTIREALLSEYSDGVRFSKMLVGCGALGDDLWESLTSMGSRTFCEFANDFSRIMAEHGHDVSETTVNSLMQALEGAMYADARAILSAAYPGVWRFTPE